MYSLYRDEYRLVHGHPFSSRIEPYVRRERAVWGGWVEEEQVAEVALGSGEEVYPGTGSGGGG